MAPQREEELTVNLARSLFAIEVGGRLPTVRELGEEHGASISSVHGALARLQDEGAVELSRRGRRGTFVEARTNGALWRIAHGGPLVISQPLPSTRRFEGLATGLKSLLTGADVPAFLTFIRGSRQRLEALRQGRCHVAVMSSFAARTLSHLESSLHELSPGSYVEGHRVFSRAGIGERPGRVLVDPDSVDQQGLTELEFQGQDVDYVSASYIQIARLMREGRVDAAVWTIEEMAIDPPEGLVERELSERVRSQIGDSDTRVCLVTRAADLAVRAVVAEAVGVGKLERIQAEVIDGRMVPEY